MILLDAFRVLGRAWFPLLVALLLCELAVFAAVIATALSIWGFLGAPDLFAPASGPVRLTDQLLIFLLPCALGIWLVQGTVGSLAATLAHLDARGRRVTVWGLLRASAPRVPGTVGCYALTCLLCPVLVSPFAPLLVWPWVLYSLAPSIMAHDRVGMFQALSRAKDLVKGAWRPVISTMALAALVTFGMDLAVGYLPVASMVNGTRGDEGATAVTLLLGVMIGAISVFIWVLMLQFAFMHLVGDRICAALRDRRATLAQSL
ncbi:hypothetical protein OG259_41170 [Streptomyces sp. NBC_00250]|uniref:hypothetical protein n=1 Tax=Streptomyces sp. NBC_00250 TaxID=2903641 RepID=UPI002E29417E|nr:hypothetical protein [Streptomyces sp. NBC_00250]